VRNLIRQILKEESKVTDKIEKMIYRLFPDTLVYTNYFYDNYDDEDVEYNIRITYRLSEKTKITKDEYGAVKPYDGNIVFDILKIESTKYDSRDEYETFYYEDDLPDSIWDEFQESLYGKIESVIPFLYSYIRFDIKTRSVN
jgi:hypothetical protein